MIMTSILLFLSALTIKSQTNTNLYPGDPLEASLSDQWTYYTIPTPLVSKTYIRIWLEITSNQGTARPVLALSPKKPTFGSTQSSVIADFVDFEEFYSESNYHSLIFLSSEISSWPEIYIGVGNANFESSSMKYKIGLDSKERILCPNDCSGNGNCVSLNKCNCFGGFIGQSCKIPAVELKESESVIRAPAYKNTYGYINMNSIKSNEIKLEMEWEGNAGVLLLNYDGNSPSSLPSLYNYYLSVILQGSDNSRELDIDVTKIKGRLYFLLYNKINPNSSLDLYIRYKESDSSVREKHVLLYSISVVIGFIAFVIAVTLYCKWKKCWLFNETMKEQEGSPGLSASFINKKYPALQFSTINLNQNSNLTCAICFEQFQGTSTVRMLHCNHLFHTLCIEEWFLTSKTCCLCKRDCSTEDSNILLAFDQKSLESQDNNQSMVTIPDDVAYDRPKIII